VHTHFQIHWKDPDFLRPFTRSVEPNKHLSSHPYSEKRWAAFGKTDAGKLLTVIFTKRDSLIRIISARAMKRKERNFYEKNQ